MKEDKVVIFVAVVFASAFAQDVSKVVNINQGPVKGYRVPNTDVFAFHGIPYATAPTGRDKFKAPLPPPSWTEPFEAVDLDIRCPQFGLRLNLSKEDCLVASVYIPETDETNLPVVFLVHGGAFLVGFGNTLTPIQLVNYKKNVIFVTVNYRLGPTGFLCLGTENIPGNTGLKDQVAALKWVHENIAYFGGNPDDITLAGCSAGGASVNYMMLSKTAKGLYKKVIGLSGPHDGVLAVQPDPTRNARNYARNINYDGPDNIAAVEEFYLTASYKQLLSYNLLNNKDISFVFSPCVERDIGIERFLHDTPTNIVKKGDYVPTPLFFGWANMEGIFRVPIFDLWKHEMNEDFTQFLPANLQFESAQQKQEVALQVKEFYFGDAPVSGDIILSYIDFVSDTMFIYDSQRSVTLQVEAGNNDIFLSSYSYVRNSTPPIPHTDAIGATHCAQYGVVMDLDESLLTPEDVTMVRTMRDLWLNFIYTGNPTPDGSIPPSMPKWEPVAADRTPCMELGHTIRVLPGAFEKDRQALWEDIYSRIPSEPTRPYDF